MQVFRPNRSNPRGHHQRSDSDDGNCNSSKYSTQQGMDPRRSVGDGSSAISSFTAALNDPRFSDVTFVLQNKEYHAHRCILAARSEVFCGMLFGGMKESVEKRIVVENIDPDIFYVILEWAYSGMARMSARDVLGVLKLANFYGFPDLEEHCRTLALSFIDEPNVVNLLDSAIDIGEDEIVSQALKFIQMNAMITIGHPSWLTLCKLGVEQVLALKEINCGECLLFDRTMDWIQHNEATEAAADSEATEANRKMLLATLLPQIRFPQMSVKDLLEKVRPLVTSTQVHFQEYVAALEYKLSPQSFFSDRSLHFCPREPSHLGKIMQKVPMSFLDGWTQLAEMDASLPLPEDTFRDINQFSTTYICVGERVRSANVLSLIAVGNIDIALRKSTNQAQWFPDGSIYWCNSAMQNLFGFASAPDQRQGLDLPAAERDKKLLWPLRKMINTPLAPAADASGSTTFGTAAPHSAETWLSGGSNQRVRFIYVK